MSDLRRPLGAQISHMLKDRGVDVIFGIPGVHNVEMYRGIEEAGITHVLARHEQGAGFMADGYARATGKMGVAYVITGPGLCNIMTPMGQAYSDSVPMLVVSSCLDEVASEKGQLHQMKDQEGAAATVCDWSHTAYSAQAAYQLIDRAILENELTRKRPKHIQVPIAVLSELAAGACAQKKKEDVPKISINATDIADRLSAATRPMIIFGGGVRDCAKSPARPIEDIARSIVDKSGAATFTTYAGRGVISPDAPLNFGSYLARGESVEPISEADLLVVIGASLAEVDLWRDQIGHNCPMIRVDIDPMVLSDKRNADETILADARLFMSGLDNALGHSGSDWTGSEVSKYRAKWRAQTDSERPNIVPICEALQQVLPLETTVYSDMTQFAYVAKEVWDMPRPALWHHPFGFGTLGYALPAAIGGKIGRADDPVIAIAGDYGFQYTIQELGCAVELGLSLPIILWDNEKLKEIEDCMVNSQIAPNAVVAMNPDFCALAKAYGAYASKPSSLVELKRAVQEALNADKPTVIHVTPNIL